MYDERSPLPGLELEMPLRMEKTLTTKPQPHACGIRVIYQGDR